MTLWRDADREIVVRGAPRHKPTVVLGCWGSL
jgi:hypothetical protein